MSSARIYWLRYFTQKCMSSKGKRKMLFGLWIFCLLPCSNHCYNSLPILLHVIRIQSLIAKQQMTNPIWWVIVTAVWNISYNNSANWNSHMTLSVHVPSFLLAWFSSSSFYSVHMYYQDHHENQPMIVHLNSTNSQLTPGGHDENDYLASHQHGEQGCSWCCTSV